MLVWSATSEDHGGPARGTAREAVQDRISEAAEDLEHRLGRADGRQIGKVQSSGSDGPRSLGISTPEPKPLREGGTDPISEQSQLGRTSGACDAQLASPDDHNRSETEVNRTAPDAVDVWCSTGPFVTPQSWLLPFQIRESKRERVCATDGFASESMNCKATSVSLTAVLWKRAMLTNCCLIWQRWTDVEQEERRLRICDFVKQCSNFERLLLFPLSADPPEAKTQLCVAAGQSRNDFTTSEREVAPWLCFSW